jgi:hypothetical protein
MLHVIAKRKKLFVPLLQLLEPPQSFIDDLRQTSAFAWGRTTTMASASTACQTRLRWCPIRWKLHRQRWSLTLLGGTLCACASIQRRDWIAAGLFRPPVSASAKVLRHRHLRGQQSSSPNRMVRRTLRPWKLLCDQGLARRTGRFPQLARQSHDLKAICLSGRGGRSPQVHTAAALQNPFVTVTSSKTADVAVVVLWLDTGSPM